MATPSCRHTKQYNAFKIGPHLIYINSYYIKNIDSKNKVGIQAVKVLKKEMNDSITAYCSSVRKSLLWH